MLEQAAATVAVVGSNGGWDEAGARVVSAAKVRTTTLMIY
jgi:hypothetical protein